MVFVNEAIDKTTPSSDVQPVSILKASNRQGTTDSKPKRAPRPQNAFMLYRQAIRDKILASNTKLHDKEVSRIAGRMWRNESETIRKSFERKADEEKLRHLSLYPGYKYKPQQRIRKRTSDNAAVQLNHKMTSRDSQFDDSHCYASQSATFQELEELPAFPPSHYIDDMIVRTFFDDTTSYTLFCENEYLPLFHSGTYK